MGHFEVDHLIKGRVKLFKIASLAYKNMIAIVTVFAFASQAAADGTFVLSNEQYIEHQKMLGELQSKSGSDKKCHLEYLDCWMVTVWDCTPAGPVTISGTTIGGCTPHQEQRCGKPTLVCN